MLAVGCLPRAGGGVRLLKDASMEEIMTASILTRVFVVLALAAGTPALADGTGACEHAVAKASTKFVGAAFKIAQNCMARTAKGKLPLTACRLSAASTGGGRFGAALGHAQHRLSKGLGACSDVRLQGMGFDAACGSPDASGPIGRVGLESCIARTHMAAVQTLVNIEFPQLGGTCGDGMVEANEVCDPKANPTGCDAGQTCVAGGLPDECTCVAQGSSTCGDGMMEDGEACDPAAQPTGCAAGTTCAGPGNANQCTCVASAPGNQCSGSCSPSCAAGQTCTCQCGSAGGQCGNGKVDAGEQCDPAASPTGCFTGDTCTGQCTCSSAAGCGNGHQDPGEACDPSSTPTGCPGDKICGAAGTSNACHCLKPGQRSCGNGAVDPGEQCDSTASPNGCLTGETCTECTCAPAGGGGGGATTTTTLPGGGGGTGGPSLSFTTAVGTANCGGAGLASPAAAPASGELDSDTAGSTKIADLGLGCLYFGGGGGTVVPPGRIPDGARSVLAVSGSTLSAGAGTGPTDCTRGAGPARKCANNNSEASCSGDGDCGGAAGSCALAANCFFGPPLPIMSPNPFGSLTTCVLNVVETAASGTVDTATGDSKVPLPLYSPLHI